MLEAILEDPEKEGAKSLFDEMTWTCTQSVEFLGFSSRYFTVFVNPVSADGADSGVLSWLCGHRHRTFSVSSPGRELAGQRGQHGSDHSRAGRWVSPELCSHTQYGPGILGIYWIRSCDSDSCYHSWLVFLCLTVAWNNDKIFLYLLIPEITTIFISQKYRIKPLLMCFKLWFESGQLTSI